MGTVASNFAGCMGKFLCASLTENLKAFCRVVVQVWPLIGALCASCFLTFLVYPGLVSEVQNCTLGSWTPILLITISHVSSFAAKWFTLLPSCWSPKQLLVISVASHMILFPLIVMCVSPSPSHPVLGEGAVWWAALFVLILGVFNGYFSCLAFISTSTHVAEERDRELAGE